LGVVLLVITMVVYQSMEESISFDRAVPRLGEAPPRFVLQPLAPRRSALSQAPVTKREEAKPVPLPDRSGQYLSMLVDWLGEARQRRPARVEHDLQTLARLDAPDVRIYRWLGSIAHRRGDELAATTYFERAVRLAPEATDLFNLATLYLLQERYPEAIRTLDRVIRLQPPFLDDTYAYLGYCLNQMGATEEAHHAWQVALELDPTNTVARRYLGGGPPPATATPPPAMATPPPPAAVTPPLPLQPPEPLLSLPPDE